MLISKFIAMDISFLGGFIASSVHVLTGPDHLAAVAPVTARKEKKHWLVGFFWGLGHLFGMLLLGGLFLAFKKIFPVDKIASTSESLVGYILIVLGVWVIFKLFKKQGQHSHKHIHINEKGETVIHEHNHSHPHEHHSMEGRKLSSEWMIFGIGTIHGFAGVTHLLILLPVLVMKNLSDSVLYLTGFALGTILSMTFFAFTIGIIRKNLKTSRLLHGFQLVMGVISIGVGIFWIWSN